VHSGSDNSYGVYLAQLLFITVLGWLGWQHLDEFVPWPVVSVLTVVIVFGACIALTELLARTPWAKPLTGRSRLPWRARPVDGEPAHALVAESAPLQPARTLAGDRVEALSST
jgi:peptidoglycan/LPS O-acetylase OafA/YrhL